MQRSITIKKQIIKSASGRPPGTQMQDTSGWNGFPQEGGWRLPQGEGEKFSHLWRTLSRATAPLCWKEPVEVVQVSGQDSSWSPPCGGHPAGRRPRDRRRSRWRDLNPALTWRRLRISQSELDDVGREREVWRPLLEPLPPRPDHD